MAYLASCVAIIHACFVGVTVVVFADSIYQGGFCGVGSIRRLCKTLANSATDFALPRPPSHEICFQTDCVTMRIITVSTSVSGKREVWFTGHYSHVSISIIECEFSYSSEDELIHGALTGPSSNLELIGYFDRRTVLRCVDWLYMLADGAALIGGLLLRTICFAGYSTAGVVLPYV
jgi:hypothetical protein